MRRGTIALAGAAALVQPSVAKVYFQEQFNDEGWQSRWTQPTKWKSESELGKWEWTTGKWHGGDESDKAIQTSEDSRFYGLSTKLDEPFTNEGKDLVLQFSVKHEQKVDCGGSYIKLLGDIDQDKFGGDSPYQIMFGPDICGHNARTHVIFNYPPKDDNLLIKKDVRVERDTLSHLYTLHVKADGTFEVFIDQQSVRSGKLEDEFDFLEPKEINDPEQSKPKDWVDETRIPDPEDKKPEGYDDIPKQIPDDSAEKPDDWDTEEDGEWEPPMIPNPEYKGDWRPKMIENPDYKGPWEHPKVPNPAYKEDANIAQRCNQCTHIGFELWQVTSKTIFDDIIVTDSLDEAKAFADKTWAAKKDKEKAMFEEHEKAEQSTADAAASHEDEEEDDDEDHDEL